MIHTIARALQLKKGTGFNPGPIPDHVKPLSHLIGASSALPPSASVRSPLVNAKMQSSTDACLGFSGAQAWRLASLKRGIDCPDLSGLMPYKIGRASIGVPNIDAGMNFEALVNAVDRFGICSEESFPFSALKVNFNIPAIALHDAYDRKGLRGIYSIAPGDTAGVKNALAHGFVPVGAFPLEASFFSESGPTLIDAPSGDIVGNHAMPVEDYQADGTYGLLNHYDVSWRDGGRCRFTEAYMARSLGFLIFDVGALP